MKKILYALIPLVLFFGLFALLFQGLGKDTKRIPSPLIGKPVPDFSLPSLYGNRIISNKDLLGKPYLLNVWGSWCPNCRYEHGLITELAESGMIDVYGLNWKDEEINAKSWLKQLGNPYKDIIVDYEGNTAINFGVYGAPESFLIDAGGIIRHKIIGELTVQNVKQELIPMINEIKKTKQ